MSDPQQLELVGMTRTNDLDTSVGAAVVAFNHAQTDREHVIEQLAAVYPDGLSDFDLARLLDRKQTSAGKRRGELRDAGWVERARDDEGNWARSLSDTCTPCAVWRLTDHGYTAHRNGEPAPRPPRQPRRRKEQP